MNNPIKLIVVDDHTLMRQGLVGLLEAVDDIAVVAEAEDGATALALLGQIEPDVALIDIGLPDMDGIGLTAEITARFPHVKVLIVTMHERDDYVFRALRAGALGYILKGSDTRDLVAAVRAVNRGDVHVHRPLTSKMVRDYLHLASPGEGAGPDPLSDRETEVVRLVAAGLTSTQIAQKLNISPHTVQSHRDHIMTKLNLHSKVELTRYAIRAGLVDLD